MKPRKMEDFDQERQDVFLLTCVLVWVVIFLFLVLRDPVWRLLHEGGLIGPGSGRPGLELTADLVNQLEEFAPAARDGDSDFEQALFEGVNRFRRELGTTDPPLPPAVFSEELRAVARSRAARLGELEAGQEPTDPDLAYPALFFSVSHPDRLVSSVVVFQQLPDAGLRTAPDFAVELVGGWMNRLRFQDLVLGARDLEVGIGAVTGTESQVSLAVVLLESVARLDRPLPGVVAQTEPLTVSGRNEGETSLELFFKGPADPGFLPLPQQRTGLAYSSELGWGQGPGNYLLRGSVRERLSDPRPMVVQ